MSLVFASSGNLPAFSTWVPQPLPTHHPSARPSSLRPSAGVGQQAHSPSLLGAGPNVLKILMAPWGFLALLALGQPCALRPAAHGPVGDERVLTGGLCTHCGQPGPLLWTCVHTETGEPRT